ncbi:hypothetical protein BCON_0431g00030 [Botryotinia convoluta]|uniref:Uncharacterized protein n=1 Tax=Botryotinia convoluta TaxID=54673 RepID=A0A4Z1H866_9HELO|nr:hypothetical protein BCON_0431g00030 [Botryotinia convoluta]
MAHSGITTVHKRMTYKPMKTRKILNEEEVIFAWASFKNLLIISDGHPKWPSIQSTPEMSTPFEECRRLRYSIKTPSNRRSGFPNDMSWLFEPVEALCLGERTIWEVANLIGGTPTYYITEVNTSKNNDPQCFSYNAYAELAKTHKEQSRNTLQQSAPNTKIQALMENQADEDKDVVERGYFLTYWLGDDLRSFMSNSDHTLRSLDLYSLGSSALVHRRSKNECRLQYVLDRLRILILRSSFTPYQKIYSFYKHGILEEQRWVAKSHWYNHGYEIYAGAKRYCALENDWNLKVRVSLSVSFPTAYSAVSEQVLQALSPNTHLPILIPELIIGRSMLSISSLLNKASDDAILPPPSKNPSNNTISPVKSFNQDEYASPVPLLAQESGNNRVSLTAKYQYQVIERSSSLSGSNYIICRSCVTSYERNPWIVCGQDKSCNKKDLVFRVFGSIYKLEAIAAQFIEEYEARIFSWDIHDFINRNRSPQGCWKLFREPQVPHRYQELFAAQQQVRKEFGYTTIYEIKSADPFTVEPVAVNDAPHQPCQISFRKDFLNSLSSPPRHGVRSLHTMEDKVCPDVLRRQTSKRQHHLLSEEEHPTKRRQESKLPESRSLEAISTIRHEFESPESPSVIERKSGSQDATISHKQTICLTCVMSYAGNPWVTCKKDNLQCHRLLVPISDSIRELQRIASNFTKEYMAEDFSWDFHGFKSRNYRPKDLWQWKRIQGEYNVPRCYQRLFAAQQQVLNKDLGHLWIFTIKRAEPFEIQHERLANFELGD